MSDSHPPAAGPETTDAAAWAAGLRLDDIPPAVAERALELLLDTLGVAIGAGRTPAAAIAYDLAAEQFAPGRVPAHLAFDGRRVSAAGAAWALATRIDNLDGHDGYQPGKGHAGVAVVPALLAAGETTAPDATGADAVAALVAGYEVACRAAVALHASAGDYHSSGAWNALGAAATAARLRGLPAETLAAALGIAEYHAPRAPMMREIDAPSMLHDSSGWGALAGVTAVDLAARGFAASPAQLPAIGDAWSTLGSEWRVARQYVKPHPVCFWAQPAVTAALCLRERHGVDPGAIERIRIDTFHEATRLYRGVPDSTHAAQYALAFPVAAALRHGRLGPAEITGAGLADARVAALTDRVEVRERAAYSRRFPHARVAAVTLRLGDGRELASGPTQPLGTPDRPMDGDAVARKYRDHAAPVIGDERCGALAARVLELAQPGARLDALVALTGSA